MSSHQVSLSTILAYHAQREPGRVAVIVGDERVTYAELDARSNRRARLMAVQGVGFGDFVTVALPNGLAFYETVFGLWKLGAIPNIVSAKMARPEMEAILDLVRPRLFIGEAPVPGLAALSETPQGLDMHSADALPEIVSPHWKAMTSGGSTGRPKVIVDAMTAQWNPQEGFLLQRPGDVILNPGPLYHNAPFHCVTMGMFVGATIVEMQRFDALRALQLIEEHGVTWVTMVPTMMHRIWRLGPDVLAQHSLPSLRMMLHMAAPCAPWLKEAWIGWLGAERVWEYYGTTEGIGSTIISGVDWLDHRGSVGQVRPGYEMKILDAAGRELPTGEVGEVYFRPEAGPGSTYRYLGSQSIRIGEWETMGDLGSMDADGYLFLSDRRNDLIISGGANIYPAEVEAALEAHPAVRGSAVIGLPSEEWGAVVHAIVQPVEGASLDEAELLDFVAGRMARFKLPKRIEFTDEPLRDEAGKVRRAALRQARLTPTEGAPLD
ncbi:MAG: AMP-binding protein [Alphaproteobacteria bacterium]|nr:AMP-binding protein [Alphaproteobacteria bacterium]MBU1521001.1 AMP-binding protein [Alphaproteobacteria bacterium]MBU2031258.1 AMP-binding protein [Alphaproteobacteria bacterium]MBU2163286.1 AMP-binding protein [Alphaproteobacteria bacterium]MBU2230584.1 AMP-binding protein [Alphaproteobacteria bacterium]